MAVSKTFAGVTFSLPEVGDSGWGQEVSDFLQLLADKAIPKSGGSHELTADLNLGATYGLVAPYYKSRGSNLASAGILRMANNESIGWRNAANSADKLLKVNASDVLEYDGNPIVTLALGTANYVLKMNSGGTAYEWGELANANIAAAAAIAHSKMAALTASRAMVTDGSGFASASSVTATELGYVSGVTSSIQTQIGTKITSGAGAIVNADINASAAIAYSKLALTGSIVNADINASAAIADTKLATISTAGKVSNSATTATNSNTANAIVARDASGNFSAGTITATLSGNATNVSGTVAIANGGTGQTTQTAAFDALAPTTTAGDLIYNNGTDNVRLGIGSAGQVLKTNAGATAPEWGDAGGGSGEKNYVTNPSASSAITGWSNVGDLDVARTNTAAELPREYTTGTGIKITADANTQSTADYVYYDFTLDDVDLNKKLKIQWAQKQTGSYVAGDLEVIITTQADRTTAVATPDVTAIPAYDGVFQATFDSASTATLSLVIRATTDMATDAGIVISDVIVGPGMIQAVPASAYLGSLSGFTVSNNGSKGFTIGNKCWRKDNLLICKFSLDGNSTASGSASTTTFTLNLPSGYTIDLTALASGSVSSLDNVGYYSDYGVSGSAVYSDQKQIRLVTSTTLGFVIGSGSNALVNIGSLNVARDMDIQGEFSVPIAEWAGAPNYAGSNDVTYASNDGSSTVYGLSGSLVPNQAVGTAVTRDIVFPHPIDQFEVKYSSAGLGWFDVTGQFPYIAQGSSQYGVSYFKLNSTTVRLTFQAQGTRPDNATYAGNGTAWSTRYTAGDRFLVIGYRPGAAVGFGHVTQNSSGLVKRAGQLLGTNTNDSAEAGNVGEVESESLSFASANSLSSGVAENLMAGTLGLSAGHWTVSGMVAFVGASGTTVSQLNVSLSNTTGTLAGNAVPSSTTGQIWAQRQLNVTLGTNEEYIAIPPYDVYVPSGSTVTLYTVVRAAFATAGLSAYGQVTARRVR